MIPVFHAIKESPITVVFIALKALIFFAYLILGNQILSGFYLPDSWSWDKLYTLLTPSLIQIDPLHFFTNMTLIWIFATGLEQLNKKLLIVLMLTSACFTNLCQYLYNDAIFGAYFGGASGIVFALFGFFIVEAYLPRFLPNNADEPHLFIQTWLSVLLIIYLIAGFSGQIGNIANIAHLSGLLLGAVWAAAIVLLNLRSIR